MWGGGVQIEKYDILFLLFTNLFRKKTRIEELRNYFIKFASVSHLQFYFIWEQK